jgi:hypothetical protein
VPFTFPGWICNNGAWRPYDNNRAMTINYGTLSFSEFYIFSIFGKSFSYFFEFIFVVLKLLFVFLFLFSVIDFSAYELEGWDDLWFCGYFTWNADLTLRDTHLYISVRSIANEGERTNERTEQG